jgi:uncharacterized membrane protein YhaH (DUF805 family)
METYIKLNIQLLEQNMKWYIKVVKKYAVFTGRASRQEFWMFMLINLLIIVGLDILPIVLKSVIKTDQSILKLVYQLVLFMPYTAVYIRRMHDTGRNGWWCCVPIVNLIFAIEDSQPGENKYGVNPKETKNYL